MVPTQNLPGCVAAHHPESTRGVQVNGPLWLAWGSRCFGGKILAPTPPPPSPSTNPNIFSVTIPRAETSRATPVRTKGMTLPTWCREGGGGEEGGGQYHTALPEPFVTWPWGWGDFFPPGPGVWIPTVEPRDAHHSAAPHEPFRRVWTLSPIGWQPRASVSPSAVAAGGASRWGHTLGGGGGSAPCFVSICTGINLAAVCCLGPCLRDASLGSGGEGKGPRRTPPHPAAGLRWAVGGCRTSQLYPSSAGSSRCGGAVPGGCGGAAGGRAALPPPPQCPPSPLPAPGMPRAASIIYI